MEYKYVYYFIYVHILERPNAYEGLTIIHSGHLYIQNVNTNDCGYMTRSMNTKIVTYLAHLVSIEKVENQICVFFYYVYLKIN